jgi:hypothetical protein
MRFIGFIIAVIFIIVVVTWLKSEVPKLLSDDYGRSVRAAISASFGSSSTTP